MNDLSSPTEEQAKNLIETSSTASHPECGIIDPSMRALVERLGELIGRAMYDKQKKQGPERAL